MSRQNPSPPTRIDVHPDDALPEILRQVRDHAGQSVVLVIPQHCPLLLTATEFRTLSDAANRARVSVSIESDDQLRSQLGAMFNIRNVATQRITPEKKEGWRPPETMLSTRRGWKTWDKQDDDAEDDDPKAGRRVDPVSVTPRRRRQDDDDSLAYIEDEETGWLTARRLGQLVAVVLVLGLLALIAGWYAMPGVTVNATLAQQSVTSEVLYSVAAEGAALPDDIEFTAPATESSADVPFTITIPTTGVQRTPQDTASGSVLFRNPTDAVVAVPAGTTLTRYGGVNYTTNDAVEVPAATDGAPGEVTVDITAAEAGATGNAEAGLLTGQLPDLGVYYSNRDLPIEGGTDTEVAVVAEDDITTLENRVQSDIQRAAANGWADQLGEGQSVVVPSVQTGEPDYEMSAEAGQEGSEVSVNGTVSATGLIYDRDAVIAQTREFVQTRLQEQVPEGYELDVDSIVLGEPTSLAEAPDNVQYRIEATAVANAIFNADQQQALASDLAGSSWNDAQGRVGEVPEFAAAELNSSPGWWFQRMPQAESRVSVDVHQQPAPEPDPSPVSSPEAGT